MVCHRERVMSRKGRLIPSQPKADDISRCNISTKDKTVLGQALETRRWRKRRKHSVH